VTRDLIKEFLFSQAEGDYMEFSSKLIPGEEQLIGVRLPVLRKYAKEIKKNENLSQFYEIYFNKTDQGISYDSFKDESKDKSEKVKNNFFMEEKLLLGMVLGMENRTFLEKQKEIEKYLLLINNWSVCDSFCVSLKPSKEEKDEVFKFLEQCICAKEDYTIRFGVVMLLDYYVEEVYLQKIFQMMELISNPNYYVKMAIAWNLSICYIKYPNQTQDFLEKTTISNEVFLKTIQKIRESRRVSKEEKVKLLVLKTKRIGLSLQK